MRDGQTFSVIEPVPAFEGRPADPSGLPSNGNPALSLGVNKSHVAVRQREAGGSGDHGRRAAGALTCEGLGKFEAPKPTGFHGPALLAHGLDSLYVSYFFDTVQSRLDWDDLAFRREQLRQRRFGSGEEITVGCETFWLLPYGKKPYSYVLSHRDFEIRLAEHLR